MIDASHGSFDNNIDVISLTLQRIVENNQLNVPVDDLRGFRWHGMWLPGLSSGSLCP